MKKMKKFLSILLIGALLAPIAGYQVKAESETTMPVNAGYLYTQDFSGSMNDLIAEGWKSSIADNYHLDGGMLVSNQDGTASGDYVFLNNKSSENWDNYTLELDATITYDVVASGTANMGIMLGTVQNATSQRQCLGVWISMAANGTVTCKPMHTNYGGSNTYSGETYTLSGFAGASLKHIKIEVKGTTMTCYIGDSTTPVFTYTHDEVSSLSAGSIGLFAQRRVCKFDNIKVTCNEVVTADDYYDVSFYRSGDTMLHPFKSGYVFGGWYEDAAYTTPLDADEKTGTAYAKWVDENVLSVKAQISAGTKDTDLKTNMRFVTTVDCLDYDKIGFVINGGGTPITYETTTVFETIIAGKGGIAVEYGTDVFSSSSYRFATVTLENLPLFKDANGNGQFDEGETDNKEKAITVTPWWITADGTYVTGVIRNDITIQRGIEAIQNSNTSTPYSL